LAVRDSPTSQMPLASIETAPQAGIAAENLRSSRSIERREPR
jgi:hypothetical protein